MQHKLRMGLVLYSIKVMSLELLSVVLRLVYEMLKMDFKAEKNDIMEFDWNCSGILTIELS